MVAIEAAAHDTLTVAFATRGIDAIKDGVSGYLIEQENYQDLTTITVHFSHGELSIDALPTIHKLCRIVFIVSIIGKI